jgi:hypothetical protein
MAGEQRVMVEMLAHRDAEAATGEIARLTIVETPSSAHQEDEPRRI